MVRCRGQFWIIWTYPRGKHVDPVALPLIQQKSALHRSHVRVAGSFDGLPHRTAMVIHTLDPITLPRSDCEQISQCSEMLVAEIDKIMNRAIEARTHEQRAYATTF